MGEPTHKQFKILESNGYRKGYTNDELTNDHWELVRSGYLKNLVTLSGQYDWILDLTDKGAGYIDAEG